MEIWEHISFSIHQERRSLSVRKGNDSIPDQGCEPETPQRKPGASAHSKVGDSDASHPQTTSRFAAAEVWVTWACPVFCPSFHSVPQHLDYAAHIQGPSLLSSLAHPHFLWKDLQTCPGTCFATFPCIFQTRQVDKQDQPSPSQSLNLNADPPLFSPHCWRLLKAAGHQESVALQIPGQTWHHFPWGGLVCGLFFSVCALKRQPLWTGKPYTWSVILTTAKLHASL